MFKKVTYQHAVRNDIFQSNIQKRIVAVMPSHNEETDIASTLKSLRELVVPQDFELDIFIALDNCTDNTEEVIRKNSEDLNIYTLETINNKERKVGALNSVYRLFFGDISETAESLPNGHKAAVKNIVAYLGIDADVYLDKDCLVTLWKELNQNYKIGSVSANYSCLLPESRNRILRNDPTAENDIKGHGAFARFVTMLQSKDFALWTIKQKVIGHRAEIAGGQCTLFRPDALKEVFRDMKLNGVYSNETDTEDLKLTQDLRQLKWKTVISSSARCWVDSMKDYKSLLNQRKKWFSGKLDFMMSSTSRESIQMWGQEVLLALNLIIRVLLLILVPLSIYTGMFRWQWIWILPLVVSGILNFIVTIKTPLHRFTDLFWSLIGVSSELWLVFEIRVHISVWLDQFKMNKKDGWALQEKAENGTLQNSYSGLLGFIAIAAIIGVMFYAKMVTIDGIAELIKPYIISGFNLLTWLTLVTFVLMVKQLWKLRGSFKA